MTWRDVDYYPKSRYADLIDAAKYCSKWFEDGNDHIVDLDNLLVWDHKQSEPIAKVTSCEMVGGPGSAASLKVEAIALTKEEKEKMDYMFTGRQNGKNASYTKIKRVIFSDPATIVFWEDGTKTVVKAHNEDFDPEKGLAMAVCKRLYGDKYHRVFKDAMKSYEKETVIKDFEGAMAKTRETIQTLVKELNAGKENK